MFMENKVSKVLFVVFSVLCIVGVMAAVIADLAINKGMSWSLYVIAAVPFGWIILSPVMLAKKGKTLWFIFMLTVAIFPFMYVLDKLTPVKGWFTVLAVPVGAAVILAVWLSFLVVKFLKIRKWYLSAFLLFVWGVAANFTIQYFVRDFVDHNFFTFDMIMNIAANMGCVILLIVLGSYSGANKKENKQVQQAEPLAEGKSVEEVKPINEGKSTEEIKPINEVKPADEITPENLEAAPEMETKEELKK